jgi:hypothetical protein
MKPLDLGIISIPSVDKYCRYQRADPSFLGGNGEGLGRQWQGIMHGLPKDTRMTMLPTLKSVEQIKEWPE